MAVASNSAGVDLTPKDPDFADALGEIANMVAGQAKSNLHGVEITTSLPRVIAAAKLICLSSPSQPILVLPCDSAFGRFTVEISMLFNSSPANAEHTSATADS